jgi:hypothetical protein
MLSKKASIQSLGRWLRPFDGRRFAVDSGVEADGTTDA